MADEVKKLAHEIYRLVEHDQGEAFVSDALEVMPTREDLFRIVRSHLFFTERTARKIRKWLRSHGQLRQGQRR